MDLGGTNLKGGIVSERGEFYDYVSAPSQVKKGPEVVMGIMLKMTRELIGKAKERGISITGIAVVSPGVIDSQFGGVTGGANNLPGWKGTPFMKIMHEKTGLPIFAHNDVTATLLGEVKFGAAVGKRNVIMATFGTGIGGGVVVDGKIYGGRTGYAGEFGHMVIHGGGYTCTCGAKGCWEEYASSRGIVRAAKSNIEGHAGGKGVLFGKIEKNNGEIDPKVIFDSARERDKLAMEIIQVIGMDTAIGVGSLINIFNPEMFVVGGGIASAGVTYLDAIEKNLPDWTLRDSLDGTEVVLSKLGYRAGIFGAAALVFEDINRLG